MNDILEKTALNELLKTVAYIAEKVDEIDQKLDQLEEMKEGDRK